MKHLCRERWLPIYGYEGYYDVSNLGRLRSYYTARKLTKIPHLTKLHICTTGYPIAHLSICGTVHRYSISRLVLQAFVGTAPVGKPYACHNDGNPLNNVLKNLRWGSNADNQNDRKLHGTSNSGEANGMALLSAAGVLDIKRRLASGEKQNSIALTLSLNQSTISNIKTGKAWAHIV